MISIKVFATTGLLSSVCFPIEVTTKLPKVARAFSDVCLIEENPKRMLSTSLEAKVFALSSMLERLYNVPKHDSFVSRFEVASRIEITNGTMIDVFMGNWLLVTDDKENISFAKSCIVSSSKTPVFSGSFDKIPASSIRALFLKNQQKKEKEISTLKSQSNPAFSSRQSVHDFENVSPF